MGSPIKTILLRLWQVFGLLLIFTPLGMFLGGCCVVEGTMVATPTGDRPIESIVVAELLKLVVSAKMPHSRQVAIFLSGLTLSV